MGKADEALLQGDAGGEGGEGGEEARLVEARREAKRSGMEKIKLAYNIGKNSDPPQSDPMVLNHLADYYFWQGQLDKVDKLAKKALQTCTAGAADAFSPGIQVRATLYNIQCSDSYVH